MKRALIAAAAFLLAGCEGPLNPSASAGGAIMPDGLPGFFDCLRENGATAVAAHRGGPAPGYAENAIETFTHTLSQAPVFMEIDIARTRDGALVLMHDDDLDRTTTGEGPVRNQALAAVQALQLEDDDGQVLDAHPPTLRDTLAWAAGRTVLQLDVKRGVSYEDVLAEVRDGDALGRVIFITYSAEAAVRVHRLAPEMMLSVPVSAIEDLDELEERGIDLTRVLAWTGTEEPNAALNVALAQRGVETAFGTLGDWDGRFARDGADQYAAFADMGLTLISTDRPIAAVRDIDAHDGAEGLAALQCLGE